MAAMPPLSRHRRRRRRPGLAAGAGYHLARACSVSPSPRSSAAGPLPGVHAKPLTCRQQYQAWRTGPAKAEAAKMITVLNAFQPAATSEDLPAMQTGLRQAGEGCPAT